MKELRAALVLMGVACVFPVRAGMAASESDAVMAQIEYRLEQNRHERLAAMIMRPEARMNAFTTDGCSGGLSIGWTYLARNVPEFNKIHGQVPPWEGCCIAHDRLYHAAGGREANGRESFVLRRKADQELRECVRRTGTKRSDALSREYDISVEEVELLYTVISELMYRAVRFGGVPCTELPWRWGYGWQACE